MAVTADLGKDPIPSLFLRYYVPTLASIMSFTAQMIINGLLLGHYIIRVLMQEAAATQGLDPQRMSFTGALKIPDRHGFWGWADR